MLSYRVRFLALVLVVGLSASAAEPVLTSVADLNAARFAYRHNLSFALTTTVVRAMLSHDRKTVCLSTHAADGWLSMRTHALAPAGTLRPGDILAVRGHTKTALPATDSVFADDWRVLGRATAEELAPASPTDALSGSHDDALVRLRGTVTGAFTDDIDAHFGWLSLSDGTNVIYTSFYLLSSPEPLTRFRHLIGARIETPAHVERDSKSSLRLKIGRYASILNPNNVTVLAPPPADPFDILGRARAKGRVVAVWQRRQALLRLHHSSEVCRVEFADEPLPKAGDFIEVSGIPMTDLYCDNLAYAVWRPTDAWTVRPVTAEKIVPDDILKTVHRDIGINPLYNGHLVRLSGHLVTVEGSVLKLECDGTLASVDISAAPELATAFAPGSRLAVCGICVMDVANWTHGGPFPRINGFLVVIRRADDITVLARPPWWTPTRFLIALAILATCIVFILLWNASLRLLVTRRSRQLVREQAEKLSAELRIEERTRLAAELHDSVAQNLTSVSMQLDAACLAPAAASGPLGATLALASRTLQSCRQELRDCLWDLRSQALDEPNLGAAIVRMLKPHLGATDLRVRFNAPRRLVSDHTAHTILRIVRELASNAIRHGRARHLLVAGCLDGRTVRFSLTDDGCGFDPSAAPGPSAGHFGLEGIRNRISRANGTFELTSEPGRTRATVTLNS